MATSLGKQNITIEYYEQGNLVEVEHISREVRQYKNGKFVVKYGPGLEVFQHGNDFKGRVDRVDFSDLVGKIGR